ncbi:phage tail family protein [Priestia sp. YIM B13486]|uniref:phage tail family protein n=1 Tax=Priestia sp. YIM B13486 TaxID=3366304 RepID=UPI00366E59D4
MRVDIYTKDWVKVDLDSLNVVTTNFILESSSPQHTREDVDMMYGTNTLGTVLAGRTMQVTFHIRAVDAYDFPLVRNEIFKLLNGLDVVYLVNTRESGKRWKVRVESAYDTAPIAMVFSQFDISFFSDSPFSESIGTTQDPLTFYAERWQFGQGILAEDDIKYTNTASSFKIYNLGDITIDPRDPKAPLTIEVTAAQTSSNIMMSLTNNTTGERWSYKGATTAGQVYQLAGVQTLLDGTSVSSKTNYGLLTLKPGYNDISRNSGISRVNFINRFYYL